MAVTVQFVDGNATFHGHRWSSPYADLEADLNIVLSLNRDRWLGNRHQSEAEQLVVAKTIEFLEDGTIVHSDAAWLPLPMVAAQYVHSVYRAATIGSGGVSHL